MCCQALRGINTRAYDNVPKIGIKENSQKIKNVWGI